MADIYTRHKPIRNKIRKYNPLSIIATGLHILHTRIDPAENPQDWMLREGTYLPWYIMLIIRWTLQYAESNVRLKQITIPEFNDLHNAINSLNDRVVLEGQPNERVLDAASRRMLFFQFPFQVRNYEIASSLSRQIIMFQYMSHNLDNTFKNITGVSLTDYFDIYFWCWAAVERGHGTKLNIPYFQNHFPVEVVNRFFSVLSLDFEGAKKFIRNHTESRDIGKWIDYQLNEHTPLERYPFFQTGGKFIPYSARLLDNNLMYNAYDIFKKHNPNFSNYFGQIFEDYVDKGVGYACDSYLREPQIKAILPKGSKTADFLIKEPKASVLIDAKSTELNPVPRVLQSKESTVKNLRSTIISGVIQIIVTAYHLRQSGRIDKDDAIFGIVVAFKDYLIGDGKRFWDDIISETVEEELGKLAIKNLIPPENIFTYPLLNLIIW
jgi:hypothetical protein